MAKEKKNKSDKKVTFEVTWNVGSKAARLDRDLRKVVRKSNRTLLFASFFLIIATAIEILMMIRVREVTDVAFAGEVAAVKNSILHIVILFVLLVPLLLLNSKVFSKYIENSMVAVKNHFLKKAFKSAGSYVERDKVTTYLSSMTNNIDLVENKFFAARYNVVSAFINIVAGCILAAIIDWKIILFATIVGVIIMVGIAILLAAISAIMNKISSSFEIYTDRLREVLSGLLIIKTNDLERRVSKEFAENSEELEQNQAKLSRINLNVNVVLQLIVSALMFGFLVFTLGFVWRGAFTPGEIIYLMLSFALVLLPGIGFFENLPETKAGKEALKKLDELFSVDAKDAGTKPFEKNADFISVRDLFFAYPLREDKEKEDEESAESIPSDTKIAKEEKFIFENLSLDLELGKKYLLVGPSGSGKSTFIKLLQKQLKPSAGEIYFGELALSEISKESLLENVAYMDQNVFLFEDSIRNNITLYKDYTEEELQKAIESARLNVFVERQDGGLNSIIYDDGKNISGGEKARVALARIIIRDSRILLLDEPFANLDRDTGSTIERRILEIGGITVFSISHIIFDENLDLYDYVLSFGPDGIKKLDVNSYKLN